MSDNLLNSIPLELFTTSEGEAILTVNILRTWDHEKRERFAKHLLGDGTWIPAATRESRCECSKTHREDNGCAFPVNRCAYCLNLEAENKRPKLRAPLFANDTYDRSMYDLIAVLTERDIENERLTRDNKELLSEMHESRIVGIKYHEATVAALEARLKVAMEALDSLSFPFNWDAYRGSLDQHEYWKREGTARELAKKALTAIKEAK